MIFLIIGNPNPIPLVLVVNLGSNIFSSFSFSIPMPLSATEIFTTEFALDRESSNIGWAWILLPSNQPEGDLKQRMQNPVRSKIQFPSAMEFLGTFVASFQERFLAMRQIAFWPDVLYVFLHSLSGQLIILLKYTNLKT